jgi:DAK2 domain fusion protein YloV
MEAWIMEKFDFKLAMAGLRGAVRMLENYREKINEMNVFPLADGDTGENMLATCRGMLDEVTNMLGDVTLGEFCDRISRRVLVCSHGNAGTILAKMVLGFLDYVKSVDKIDLDTIDAALGQACLQARQAVDNPQPGTILTVLDRMASFVGLKNRFGPGRPVMDMLADLRTVAYDAVDETPHLMPLLLENGVVDSGGLGLAMIVEGFVAGVSGGELDFSIYDERLQAYEPKVKIEQVYHQDDDHTHCTELVFYPSRVVKVDKVVGYLKKMGNSVIFAEDGATGMYKVHVHTDRPMAIVTYFKRRGRVEIVQASDMRNQIAKRLEDLVDRKPRRFGFVAVADGRGLSEVLKDVGADIVIGSRKARNVLIKDILAAACLVGRYVNDVFIFLDREDYGLSDERLWRVVGKKAWLISARNAAQIPYAMTTFDQSETAERNAMAMREVVSNVQVGEIIYVAKNTRLPGGMVAKRGDYLGMISADGASHVMVDGHLGRMMVMMAEVMLKNVDYATIYYDGGRFGLEDAQRWQAEVLRYAHASLAEVAVDVFYGGQAAQSLIMAAE